MTDSIRALTIQQPWASLIALGVKSIETRGYGTPFRGPLVIHAGARAARLHEAEAAWDRVGLRYDDLIATLYPARDRGADPLPLGAVVAVVDLVDVVPIIDGSLGWTEDSDTPPAAVVVSWRSAAMLVDTREIGSFPDLTDQLPYGNFTPGRWAWILDNPRVIDPPIPAKGKLGPWRPDPALRLEVSKAAHLDEVAR